MTHTCEKRPGKKRQADASWRIRFRYTHNLTHAYEKRPEGKPAHALYV